MNHSLKTCLTFCAGWFIAGLWLLVFAESAAQKGYAVGTMITSLGIGMALSMAAEL